MHYFWHFLSFWLVGLMTASGATAVSDGEELVARKLINSQGCKACHSLEGDGSSLAVSLETASQRLTREQLRETLVSARGFHDSGQIPDFSHLQPEEINALVNFLDRLKTP